VLYSNRAPFSHIGDDKGLPSQGDAQKFSIQELSELVPRIG